MSKKIDSKVIAAMASITQLGLNIVSPLILLILLANYLIKKFGWDRRIMLAAIILGALSGFMSLIKFIKQATR